MAHRGAPEVRIHRFRGVCTQVDPTELPDWLGADCLDVDFDGETLQRRLGTSRYNSGSALASPIDGISSWYAQNATDRLFLVAAGSKVYADRGTDGVFAAGDEIASGLTGGSPMDFWFWRDDSIYFGNGVDSVRKSVGGAASAVVAPITAPASAATVAPSILQAETFDATAWTSTNAALTSAYDSTIRREGSNCLKLTVSGSGALNAFVYRALSAGATVDLSDAKELVLWVQGNMPGLQFQVALYDDTQTTLSSGPTWGRFPTWTIREANVWTKIVVPLGDIKPGDRDAVPGIAIKFISEGGRGYTTNPLLYFDDARVQGTMVPDRYSVYYTYAQVDASNNVIRESAPCPVAEVDLSAGAPFRGISCGVTASADGTVNQIRVYERRNNGFWPRPKLVKTAANANATLVLTKDEGAVDLDPAAVELQFYRNAPPLAKTYAIVGKRLLCGDVTVSATRYRNRVYVSAFNDPESFSPSEHVNVPDPNAAGWFDLPRGHNVIRIVDVDGMAVIFTDRSIWTLQGDGWDNFRVELRAEVGLDSRWAVAQTDRLIYILSGDGIRAVAPNRSFNTSFETWRIDEPVADLLRSISNTTFTGKRRQKVAMGVDERGRIHVAYSASGSSTNNAGLVFDPALDPAALGRAYNPLRPGWTRYSAWKYSSFHTLRFAVNDQGQMIAAEDGGNYLAWIHYQYATLTGGSSAIQDSTLQWSFTGKGFDVGTDGLVEVVHVAADADGSAQGAAVLDRGETTAVDVALTVPSPNRGLIARAGPTKRARIVQPKIYSDGAKTATVVRSLSVGYYQRY